MTPEERSEIARNAVRARWARAGKLKESPPESETKESIAAIEDSTAVAAAVAVSC
jgi:hypothetical protein